MSLAQAFQTAAAYRQATIDQNQQAAMQTPMLAVQALSVGLQAQAQQQDMQFKMQSMVLNTQLQIEETKSKQAMQLMEFDLKSRQFNANEQIARKQLEFERLRTDASVAASDLQRSVAKAQLDREMGLQVADTALSQLRSVYTNRQIYSGAADQDIQMLGEKNPVAANLLREKLIAEKRGEAAPVLSQIDQLERRRADRLREDTRGMTFREATIARQRINSDFDAALAPLREDATLLTGRNLVAPSQTSLSDLFGARSLLTPAESIDALAEIRQTMSTLDPVADKDVMDSLRTRQESLLESLMPRANTPTGPTPLQTALADATAARAKLQTQQARTQDPARLVENKRIAEDTAYVDAFEATVVPKASGVLDQVIQRADNVESVAEAQKLQSIMSAAIEATKRGVSGIGAAMARRELSPAEPGMTTGTRIGPGVTPQVNSARVRSFTRAELDSLAKDPSYENVKRILSRLEVR